MLLVFYLTRRKMNFLKENQVKIQSRMGDGWKWVAKFVRDACQTGGHFKLTRVVISESFFPDSCSVLPF